MDYLTLLGVDRDAAGEYAPELARTLAAVREGTEKLGLTAETSAGRTDGGAERETPEAAIMRIPYTEADYMRALGLTDEGGNAQRAVDKIRRAGERENAARDWTAELNLDVPVGEAALTDDVPRDILDANLTNRQPPGRLIRSVFFAR